MLISPKTIKLIKRNNLLLRSSVERLKYNASSPIRFISRIDHALCGDCDRPVLQLVVICTINRFWNRVPGCNCPGTRYPVSTRAQDINYDLRGGEGVDGWVNN